MRQRKIIGKESSHTLASEPLRFVYPSLTETSLPSVVWSEDIAQQLERSFVEENEKQVEMVPTSIDSRDQLPLYKYRTIDRPHPERTVEIISQAKLWSPSLAQLNDPLEGAVVLGDSTVPEWEIPAVAMWAQSPWAGCICFTYDAVCVQMWAHYAESHAGFVVKYERADSWLLRSPFCRSVKYRRRLPVFDILSNPAALEDLFWTKSEAWEYEREVRLRYPRVGAYTAAGLLKPSGIIFGLRTPQGDKDFLREAAQGIRCGQIIFADDPYRLKVSWDE